MTKKFRFLVSLHTRENDFQVAQGQSAEDAARRLGSDVEIVFADNDAVNPEHSTSEGNPRPG